MHAEEQFRPPGAGDLGLESWEAKKATHLRLSARAAPHYDAQYAAASFATGQYMRYEEQVLHDAIGQAPLPRRLAGEIGCGTGRESAVLARQFEQVVGLDFCPAMVDQAQRRKLLEHLGNVLFQVHDAESGQLPWTAASVSLVTSAFGMGSFVRDPEALLQEVRRVLMPGGIALFSFYNSQVQNAASLNAWRQPI